MSATVLEHHRPRKALMAPVLHIWSGLPWLLLSAFALTVGSSFGSYGSPLADIGLTYTNHEVGEVPWSIHVVRLELTNALYEIRSIHARGTALGLSPLSTQMKLVDPALGSPVAAINGDFYVRDRAFAGHPRGLQIVDGEVISESGGGVTFWIDVLGEPHVTNVMSLFQVAWPDGTMTPCGLNGERRPGAVVLYTPRLGRSTHTMGGRELILERQGENPWLPLRAGRMYSARVREVRDTGDTRLEPGTMVLSLGPSIMRSLPRVEPGAELKISTMTSPGLRGVRTAISGGPTLVHEGKRQRIRSSGSESYVFTSMSERHPRAAIGWNKRYFFLVEVDGRQRDLSIGMTLNELSDYLVRLGCDEAMNFDGGGSATLWYDGEVRNSPCDRYERPIANSLVIVKRNPEPRTSDAAQSK